MKAAQITLTIELEVDDETNEKSLDSLAAYLAGLVHGTMHGRVRPLSGFTSIEGEVKRRVKVASEHAQERIGP